MGFTIGPSAVGSLTDVNYQFNSYYYGGGYETKGPVSYKNASSSYIVMPGGVTGGLIVQAGHLTTGSGVRYGTTVYFPTSFPNACLAVCVNEGNASGWATNEATIHAVTDFASGYFYLQSGYIYGNQTVGAIGGSYGANWLAVGY